MKKVRCCPLALIWIDLARISLHDIANGCGWRIPSTVMEQEPHTCTITEAAGCIRLRVHGTQAVDAGEEPSALDVAILDAVR